MSTNKFYTFVVLEGKWCQEELNNIFELRKIEV